MFCKLGGTELVTKAVGAFSFFRFFVILADGAVPIFGCFWIPRRRFLQI